MNDKRQAALSEIADAIGEAEGWGDPQGSCTTYSGVPRFAATDLKRIASRYREIAIQDSDGNGTATYLVMIVEGAVVECAVYVPPYQDNVEDDATVEVRFIEPKGEGESNILEAFESAASRRATDVAERTLCWLRGITPAELAKALREVFPGDACKSLMDELAKPASVADVLA